MRRKLLITALLIGALVAVSLVREVAPSTAASDIDSLEVLAAGPVA